MTDRPGSVLTVGTFDGVHLGHRAVLEQIKDRAIRRSLRSVLVTFEPHPLEVVNPHAAPPLLTDPDERREILALCEVDRVVILPFTKTLSQYSPEQFVLLLQDRYGMVELVIGHDHGFGKGRAGDENVLRSLGQRHGFTVEIVEPVSSVGKSVSSTLVRRAIAGGDLDTAKSLLGRPYSLMGLVGKGAGRGKGLGYPTINLTLRHPRKLLPPDGVYAVWAEWGGGQAGGMMHQGPRPTFDDLGPTVEVHLFGVDDDLYDRTVKVSWVTRLRDIEAFSDVQALVTQIGRDEAAARDALTRSWRKASH